MIDRKSPLRVRRGLFQNSLFVKCGCVWYDGEKGGYGVKRDLKLQVILLSAFLLVFALTSSRGCPDASDNPEQELIVGDGWTITGQRGARGETFYQCEGTDELVYFGYFFSDVVDAYDLSGEYQYTIHLPDAQNGGLLINCQDDLLIAAAANGDVFVFRGTELLEKLDHKTARERGYRASSVDRDSRYAITRTHVVSADGEELFELPPEIRENLTWDMFLTEPQRKITEVLFLVLFSAAWLTVVGTCVAKMWKGFREDRGKR